jgi:hypothetical protein
MMYSTITAPIPAMIRMVVASILLSSRLIEFEVNQLLLLEFVPFDGQDLLSDAFRQTAGKS